MLQFPSFLRLNDIHCMCMLQFAYLFVYQYTFGLFPPFGYSENGAIKVGVHTSVWELSVFTLKNYMIDIYSLGLEHDVFLFRLILICFHP